MRWRTTRKYKDVNLVSYELFLKKMKNVFSNLRKQGFITKKNFMCCNSCASSAIYQQIEKSPRKRPTGIIFWNRQDNERLVSEGNTYLSYKYPRNNNEEIKKISDIISKHIVLISKDKIEEVIKSIYYRFGFNDVDKIVNFICEKLEFGDVSTVKVSVEQAREEYNKFESNDDNNIKKVGEIICEQLKSNNVKFEWSGNISERIFVSAS